MNEVKYMNGGETIINRIKADGEQSVAAIRSDADRANAAVLAEAQKQALARKEELAAETDAKVAQIRTASKSRAELAARTALLLEIRVAETVDCGRKADEHREISQRYALCNGSRRD